MAFPAAPRFEYEMNPLEEVLGQLRFPSILRISADKLADFQENLRKDYPFYEKKPSLNLPPGLPREMAEAFATDLPGGGQYSHWFESRDRNWAITLRSDALTLTARDYR